VNIRVLLMMILKLVCLLLAVTSSLCSSRPHIVFILADDMVSTYNLFDDQSFISGVTGILLLMWSLIVLKRKKLIFSIIATQADTLRPERLDNFMSKPIYYECPGLLISGLHQTSICECQNGYFIHKKGGL